MVLKKQTATNNADLQILKSKANDRIFKTASKILNEQGRAEMIAFLYTIDTKAFGLDK